MYLLFFLQSGLLCSAKRWKFAFNKNGMFLFCVILVYGLMIFASYPWWYWLLPLICYLLVLLVTLVVPNDEMTVGKGKRKIKFVVYALGESQFGRVDDGLFLKTRRYRVFDIVPIKVYRRRFGEKPVMLIQLADSPASYLYSEDYPSGNYLGYSLDEDMVVFQDYVFRTTYIVEPGAVFKYMNVRRVLCGDGLYSAYWENALYAELGAKSEDDEFDALGYDDFSYYHQVDERHFFLIEHEDGGIELFFVLLSKDNVVAVLKIKNVDSLRFVTLDNQTLELQYDKEKKHYFLV